ncbi:NAD-dependent epimerase/dehydratase family protein, partial [Patescibacteria group bacterium]|nr:NAD-dependent epimerase/dehydratase family protein [Patescibacteria group bacterium]
VLVTGGAGFIGSHLVDHLIKAGHRVIIIDDLSSGSRQNLNKKAKFIKQKVQHQTMPGIFKANKVDFVFHLAAQIKLQFSKKYPAEDAETNIIGSLRVLDAARQAKVKKLIFFSSAAVYNIQDKPLNKETDIILPEIPYGIAKHAVEQYIIKSGLKYSILRPSNVYGSRQGAFGEGGVVAIFCSQAAKNRASVINNTGHQTRDFIHVSDIAAGALKTINMAHNQVINLSTARETTINELYDLIYSLVAKKIKPIRGVYLDEQYRSALNNKLAKKRLNWQPRMLLAEGLKETYNWFIKKYE